jgi:hypothetical protein
MIMSRVHVRVCVFDAAKSSCESRGRHVKP